MNNLHPLNLFFSGSVDEKMATSFRLLEAHGPSLLSVPMVTASLDRLKKSGENLNGIMTRLEMDVICSMCASKSGGGCCSAFMANNTDAILLLINLLIGRPVARQRDDSECCFLGAHGCILQPKPIFCLNYNCWRIKEKIPNAGMKELQRMANIVLGEQVALEGTVLSLLAEYKKI